MALPVTQRAYTLRLRGVENDNSWRDRLWRTHEAVNKGAKAFGDWLLTMRGGLSHELVDIKVKTKNSERDPNDDERRDRRIVLALSWLSVESEKGAPEKFIVPYDTDTKTGRRIWKTVDELKKILKSQGLSSSEIDQWVKDCSDSLSAAIRDDAVWVNRSKAFDDICNGQDILKARKDAHTLLWFLLTDDYLVLPRKTKKEKKSKELAGAEDEQGSFGEEIEEEKQNAAIQSGKGAGQRTRHLFSHIFGDSEGFGEKKQPLELKNFWKNILKPCVEESGIPLSGTKQTKKNSNEKSPTELQREMFSKAASRLAQIHTKQKQQEVEREQRKSADEKLKHLESNSAYNEALKKLKEYCKRFEESSGSLRGFQIQPRQVTGWEAVVEAWAKITETDTDKAEEKRIGEAKRLQDELRDEKFGDINLFIRLAEEEYKPVWWHSDKAEADASILKIFVKGMKARADAEFLKVAAFRHPDPYFNPVFCQFGVSRPIIKFNRLDPSQSEEDVRTVRMLTWNGQTADWFRYLAVSKHFDADIGSICDSTYKGSTKPPSVSRRDRLNLSAVGSNKDKVRVANVFDPKEVEGRKKDNESGNMDTEKAKKKPEWNGTLQADRRDLEKIGKLIPTNKTKADNLIKKLNWSLIVSMELQPKGPWIDYAADFADDALAKPFVSLKGEYAVKHKGNDNRKSHAKLILSRLPGLRVLSVDLGHRYAAACAVWETLTNEQVKKACKEAGHKVPTADDLYLHLKSKGQNGKDKTIIHRRIGADALPDGKPHPAPWARLDRQFLIKLQGEQEAARKASPAEIEAFRKLEQELGHKALEGRSFQIDDLMSDAVRLVRLGLKRHSDRARIAHYLITDKKVKPGSVEMLDDNGRIEMLTNSLELWHDLFSGSQWTDEWAKEKWDEYIKPLLNEADLPESLSEEETLTSKERKKRKEDFRAKIKPVAEKLAKQDNMKLHVLWATRWREDDANWKKRLRWLRDWILPKGKSADSPAIRHVGGLSLTRIATMKSLYQVQKAYFTRLKPDGTHETAGEGFGQSILDAMENMREQRVKQLTSRIVEAALGVGRIKIPKKGKDPKRLCERVDAPCHAVVIENLTHYRPEETRTRRENRQIMTWSSSKVKKYLAEACQLHGLHLREVQAGYTSRQDSRTGAPGIRCVDVPTKEFLDSPFWKKELKSAESKNDARSKYLIALYEKASSMTDDEKENISLRIPFKGGDIFVSADKNSPASKGIQADLNAAANIGLKALLDPDWPGRWWYVPCDSKEFKPIKDKVGGSTAIDVVNKSLKTTAAEDTAEDSSIRKGKKKHAKKSEGKSKEVVNLWRDVSSKPLTEGEWLDYPHYQNQVQARVIEILRKRVGLDDNS